MTPATLAMPLLIRRPGRATGAAPAHAAVPD